MSTEDDSDRFPDRRVENKPGYNSIRIEGNGGNIAKVKDRVKGRATTAVRFTAETGGRGAVERGDGTAVHDLLRVGDVSAKHENLLGLTLDEN
ncbi:hypothetical protein GWI33_021068 [Rhynchophorus ferrugineus]|uniref:Uncharacterized protein n=1 Tax=Rhynchophorus ferrugineus TaxID=354439 RepID=A0A834HQD7_RHYFE|nr:hypothetical protein GWI33_021068 [Rhynchophorus ferrugineus]